MTKVMESVPIESFQKMLVVSFINGDHGEPQMLDSPLFRRYPNLVTTIDRKKNNGTA